MRDPKGGPCSLPLCKEGYDVEATLEELVNQVRSAAPLGPAGHAAENKKCMAKQDGVSRLLVAFQSVARRTEADTHEAKPRAEWERVPSATAREA